MYTFTKDVFGRILQCNVFLNAIYSASIFIPLYTRLTIKNLYNIIEDC